MTDRYVVLLRGINVGGKNRLAMSTFAQMLTAAGCRDVTTYIQSGNAVCTADRDLAGSLPAMISARIAEEIGLRVPMTIRSLDQMRDLIAANPYLVPGAADDTLHLMFLADLPTPARLALLDPERSAPDSFTVRGREIYLSLPNGLARSKLTNAYFDSKLATVSTIRNWRTVLKLGALLDP